MPTIPITISGQLDVDSELISGKIEVSGVLNLLLAGGPPPPWTPASLGAALIGWYKADAGVYVDAGSTLATNGQTVQQWNDQSGNGYNLSQATGGLRPTYLSAGFNSLPTVQFVAATPTSMKTQSAPVLLGGTTASAFAVGQNQMAAGSGVYTFSRAVSYIESGQTGDYNNPGSAAFILRDSNTNNITGYRNSVQMADKPFSPSTDMRIGSVFDGVNNTIYVNNVASATTANSGTFGAAGDIRVGLDNVTDGWEGPFSEIVVVNIGLSPTQLTQLDDYFRAKWGL